MGSRWVRIPPFQLPPIYHLNARADKRLSKRFGNPKKPYTTRPLLYYTPATSDHPSNLIIQYARRTFTGFQALPRSPDIPPITEAQAEALDALHYTAERTALGLDFRQGDIQYINNLSIFHARDGFEDSDVQQ